MSWKHTPPFELLEVPLQTFSWLDGDEMLENMMSFSCYGAGSRWGIPITLQKMQDITELSSSKPRSEAHARDTVSMRPKRGYMS